MGQCYVPEVEGEFSRVDGGGGLRLPQTAGSAKRTLRLNAPARAGLGVPDSGNSLSCVSSGESFEGLYSSSSGRLISMPQVKKAMSTYRIAQERPLSRRVIAQTWCAAEDTSLTR